MSKVEIDVTANTSQAERAMVALTGDVDKLLSRARKLQNRRERDRKENRIELREQGRYQRKPSVDVKVINNNTTELGNSLENLTNLFESFADKIGGSFSDFYAKLQMFGNAFRKFEHTLHSVGAYRSLTGKGDSYDEIVADSIKTKVKNIWDSNWAARETFKALPGASRIIARDAINSRMTSALNRGWGRVDNGLEMAPSGGFRRSYRLIPREQLRDKYGKIIPESQPGSARFNRGLVQLRYGNNVPTGGLGRLALSGGRLTGLGNIALGGGRMALSALGGGSALAGGAILGAAVPAVPAAAFGATMAYANKRVDQGRAKAEGYEKLNAQLSQLSKNLTSDRAAATALSSEIQKLAVEGVTPIEGLTKGASMLMLAFKGNQTETSKWLPILADMSAGTGESVEHFAELITRANQFGTVDFEVFNQLNEKGIPIIEQLKGKFGETKEEIMKAAQAGKITSEEFMKAFEAAHKVSMAGTNARMRTETISDLQKQTQEYEELGAAHYTRGYDDEMMNFERWRNRRAKERSEDESLRMQGEALGSVLANVSEGFKRLNEHLSHFGDWLVSKFASWTGLTDANAGVEIERLALNNTTTSILSDGINDFEEEGSDKRYYSSAELSTAVKETENRRDRLSRIVNDDDFDDETRNQAKKVLDETEKLLNDLEASYEAALKREQELAEARRIAAEEAARAKEAEETRIAFLRETAKTDEEMLNSHGFETLNDVTQEMESIANRIKGGQGSESDRERYEELSDLADAVREYRDNQQKEREEAETRRREEAEKLAREERARDEYRLEHAAVLNPDDKELNVHREYDALAEKLKNLGFSIDEADQMMTERRAADIVTREKAMAENDKKIAEERENIENASKTGIGMEINAWGSTGTVYTQFASPYEKEQLKQLEEVNANLQAEIDALNRLDIQARAR